MLRQSYNVDFGYVSLFEVIGTVTAYFVQSCYARGSCTVQSSTLHSARSTPVTGLNKICSHSTDNFKKNI